MATVLPTPEPPDGALPESVWRAPLVPAAVGAAYHHYQRDVYPPDDVGHAAPATPWPARLRGRLDAEPRRNPPVTGDPLRSRDRQETTATLLRVTHLHRAEGWVEASGRVRLVVTG